MSADKSEHNPCPVCGKPRGKGPDEYSHGKCAEIRAATEGKKVHHSFLIGKKMGKASVEGYERGKRRKAAKHYLSGKLPKWMFD